MARWVHIAPTKGEVRRCELVAAQLGRPARTDFGSIRSQALQQTRRAHLTRKRRAPVPRAERGPRGGRTMNVAGDWRGLRASDQERFLSKVLISDGCWGFEGHHDRDRYPQFTVRGLPVRASRFMYEMLNGPIPAGRMVCHSCDRPQCVNPEHLWLGTAKDNMRDCVAKGRHARHSGGGRRNAPRDAVGRFQCATS